MEMTQQKRYRKNYIKLLAVIAGVFPLIWNSIALITGIPFENHPNLKLFIGVISLAFWVILITWMIIHTIKTPYALVLDSHGLISYTDSNGGQQIKWADIDDIKIETVRNIELIGINLKSKAKSNLIRQNAKFEKTINRNQTKYKYDVVIEPKGFKQDARKLVNEIQSFRDENILQLKKIKLTADNS